MDNQPTAVRTGEHLNNEALSAYLQTHLGGQGPLEVQQFGGGYSNLTYAVRWGEATYVLRRPPFGVKGKGGHDMEREYHILEALQPVYAQSPKPVLFCGEETVLGAPFYLMERVNGVILRPPLRDARWQDPTLMRTLSEKLVDNLVDLHALQVAGTPLEMLGKPEGYVQRQVEGWIGRYEKSQTDDVPIVDELGRWLRANQPTPRYVAFLHNDYRYDNVVFSPDLTRITAVLDWEMATVGDPLTDVGLMLAYWVEANDAPAFRVFNVTHLAGNLTRQEVAERYAQRTGRSVADVVFYYALGQYKLAVILQQIYYRYAKGITQDTRFQGFGQLMQLSVNTALHAIERGSL